jgi:hypothetical protein
MRLQHLRVATSAALTTENTALLLLRARFRRNVFTELLPNKELFRLSGVMLQYKTRRRYPSNEKEAKRSILGNRELWNV